MKKIILSAMALGLFASASFAQVAKFVNETYDYGKIKQHDTAPRSFKFTNTGDKPLEIKAAQGSCGCTVPKYPKEPIMPGESATVDAVFNAAAVGPFTKYITLTTNAPGQESIRLTIQGEVLTPEAGAAAAPAPAPAPAPAVVATPVPAKPAATATTAKPAPKKKAKAKVAAAPATTAAPAKTVAPVKAPAPKPMPKG